MFLQSRSCLWHECIQLAGRYFELPVVVDMSERAVPDVFEVSMDFVISCSLLIPGRLCS